MSNRFAAPRRAHPLGGRGAAIETLAARRDAFGGPVAVVADDPEGHAGTALHCALGGADAAVAIDWTDAGASTLCAALADLPARTAALVVRIDTTALRTAGPHGRALRPDLVVFAGGADPAVCHDALERLGGAGALVLPRDDPRFTACCAAVAEFRGLRCLSYGAARGASVRRVDGHLYTTCSAVTAEIGRDVVDYCIGAPGEARVAASLAALAGLKALGGDPVAASTRFAAAAGSGAARRPDAPAAPRPTPAHGPG